jgi:hypothetical protein
VKQNIEENGDFSLINAKASFFNGPAIEISDSRCVNYLVQLLYFYKGEWIVSYEGPNVESGFSYGSYITNRHKWKWLVYGYENQEIKLLFQKTYNEKDKRILIEFSTDSSELEKVYFAKAMKYQKENSCEVWIKSKYHKKLKEAFPNFVRFLKPSDNVDDVYAYYNITRNEIETKRFDHQYSKKLWANRARPNITVNHQENWIEYPQEELFEDIMNYE